MIKRLFLFPKRFFSILLVLVFIYSCSSESSSNSGINVSSYYPVDISPTALNEQIIVQFTKVSGIGAVIHIIIWCCSPFIFTFYSIYL